MFRNLSIKTKLSVGFGMIVAMVLVVLALAYSNFARMSDADRWNRHTLEVLLETKHVATEVLQVQSSTRGYLLTGNDVLLAPIHSDYVSAREHLDRALALTADNPIQQERLKHLRTVLGAWMEQDLLPRLEKRRKLGTIAPGVLSPNGENAVLTGAATMSNIRQLLSDAEAEEGRLLALRSEESQSMQHTMSIVLTGGALASVLLSIGVAAGVVGAIVRPLDSVTRAVCAIASGQHGARADVLSDDELGQVAREFNRMAQVIEDSQAKELAATNELRSKVDALLDVVSKAARGDLTGTITTRGEDAIGRLGEGLATMFGNLRSLLTNVQRAGIQVTTSATQIAAAAREQEATGIEQARTSAEVLSTTQGISANTTQLLVTMEEATRVADYTAAATADAQDNLKRMDQSMQQMVAATDSIGAKLTALAEKTNDITGVLFTIIKVADQTNILSLNAAIEAEKAGEAGRGFAVVASEIRRLADQTSVSIWDIEQMLKEIQSAVSASVMGMDKFADEIRRSVGDARHVAGHLSGMMDQVHKLAPRFDLVLQGMQSQAVGASQISETMMQLSDASQQAVGSLKATSEAVHQLQYAADGLQQSVATFAVNQ